MARFLPQLPRRAWCPCLAVQTPRAAARELLAELSELLRSPSLDELSDVVFALGRLLGALSRRVLVPLPGMGPHLSKITSRMEQHGCVRSVRHLIDGACPSRP